MSSNPPLLTAHVEVKSGSSTFGLLIFEAPARDLQVLDLQVKNLKIIVNARFGVLPVGQAWFLRASPGSIVLQSLSGNEFLFELGDGGVGRFIPYLPAGRAIDTYLHFLVQCNYDPGVDSVPTVQSMQYMDLPELRLTMQSMQSEPSEPSARGQQFAEQESRSSRLEEEHAMEEEEGEEEEEEKEDVPSERDVEHPAWRTPSDGYVPGERAIYEMGLARLQQWRSPTNNMSMVKLLRPSFICGESHRQHG